MSRRPVEERGWWSRNWGWCCPLSGCLGCLGLALLLIVLAVGSAFWVVRGSEIDEMAMEIASQHPAVIEALGQPVERGWGFSGNVQRSTSGGSADIRFEIHGPDGRGRLHVTAERRDGKWVLDSLEFRPEGSSSWIDLLNDADTPVGDVRLSVRFRGAALPALRGFGTHTTQALRISR